MRTQSVKVNSFQLMPLGRKRFLVSASGDIFPGIIAVAVCQGSSNYGNCNFYTYAVDEDGFVFEGDELNSGCEGMLVDKLEVNSPLWLGIVKLSSEHAVRTRCKELGLPIVELSSTGVVHDKDR